MIRFMVRVRNPAILESTGMDRSAAERLVKKDLDATTGLGKPISSRARMSQRTVEAYLKAGVRPRWMERIAEIDRSIAAQKRRLERSHRALREECGGRPALFAERWTRVRRALPLRRAQRADRAAQRVVPDRARPADGPAHPRLRADQRALLPARAAARAEWVLRQFPAE